MAGSVSVFRYQAQTADGHALSGDVKAQDTADAQAALESAGLRVIELERAERSSQGGAIRGADFMAFNQQLAQLAAAGMPMAAGLRLIARDIRRGRAAGAIHAVADELDRGSSLSEAFARQQGRFPPMYARLVEAGVKSGRLPGVLLNLGRHLDMLRRLRDAIWRAAAYPLVVLVAIAAVMTFIGIVIIPTFGEIYADFDTTLPRLTMALLIAAQWTIPAAVVFFSALIVIPLGWLLLKTAGLGPVLSDAFLKPLPLIGPALGRAAVSRWCDALRLGVESGMDLPAAIAMAGDTAGSTLLQRDGRKLIDALENGRSVDTVTALALLPPTVPAAIQLASQQSDLAAMLLDLSVMYEQQAELRLSGVQTMLGPVLMIGLAVLIGFVVVALFLPLVKITQSVM